MGGDAVAAGGQAVRVDEDEVAWTQVPSPLGDVVLAGTPAGLVLLHYEHGRRDALLARLAAQVSPRVVERPSALDGARRQLDEYFSGRRQVFDLRLDWRLVPGVFARAVLETALRIPFGVVRTYAAVAADAGNARASRAAGAALGANPLAVVVPCHRVLRTGGGLAGYATGVDKKHWLLRHEGVLT
jgi:methylated-DNA-[protein]-cysteine S-methyltransferase